MFKSLQIVNNLKNFDLKRKQKVKLDPIKSNNKPQMKKSIKIDKNIMLTKQFKIQIQRKSCFTNLQSHNRFSTRIQVKKFNSPKKLQNNLQNPINNDKKLQTDQSHRDSTATVKMSKQQSIENLRDQDQISTNRKLFNRKNEGITLKQLFKIQYDKSRLNNQINLTDKVDILLSYKQQRQNFLNYLAYLIYYVNQEEKDCDQKTEVKLQTFFKAVQLFDNYLCIQEKKLDQAQIFSTTQACILIASKLQDIYYIDINQIEFDENCQHKIYIQEKIMVEQLDYKLCYTTELDFLFDYLLLFEIESKQKKQHFFKNCIKNLLIIIRDHEIRSYKSNTITQTVIMYTFMQLFQDDFEQIEKIIIKNNWDQELLENCTQIMEKSLATNQPKYLENIEKIIDYI